MNQEKTIDIPFYNFINNNEKLILLRKTNEILNIHKSPYNKIIFIYSAPKVGSTSIVSSLRIFCSNKFNIIHIHDEIMLKVLGNIQGITINELIQYNKYLGKEVYVIDVYRNPIEQKISTFFEKISSLHFNNTDENVNNYNIDKVISRFNNIFPHIVIGDHFIDKYEINIPINFDYNNKFIYVKENGINYIKLRLMDSNCWGDILSNIFQTKICIIKDYESNNKPIKDLYNLFTINYKVPINFLNDIMECKYYNYYNSENDKHNYFNHWISKSTNTWTSFTIDQYKLYTDISLENSFIDFIQFDHYKDEGCICNACNIKRTNIAFQIINGFVSNERIIHTNAKNELLNKQINKIKILNHFVANIPKKSRSKNFNGEMTKIVRIKN
jgi:hypothetical protein